MFEMVSRAYIKELLTPMPDFNRERFYRIL